jgi:hypothetical protein
MAYGILNTTSILNAKPMSFVSDADAIENGWFVQDGGLVDGEEQIYKAVKPATATLGRKVYLVGNPATNNDTSKATNQNAMEFINKKNLPFRVYDPSANNKFQVLSASLTGTVAVGNYITAANGSYLGTASADEPDYSAYGFVAVIERVTQAGMFLPIGEFGMTDGDGLGTGIDGRVTLVTFRVLKNDLTYKEEI